MEARKVALVTGAAKGIGRQTCLALAKEGYDIAINYRSTPTKAQELCEQVISLGVRGEIIYADMAKLSDIAAMYDVVYEKFGRLDLLVNNAGVSDEVYFLDATEENFDYVASIDWKGLFFSSQNAAKRMIAQDTKGVIVNVTSNQVDGCWPRATIYASCKAAVHKFTQNAAMELSLHGIRMVAIAPGYTDVGWGSDSHLRLAKERLPLRRFATVEEVAKGIVYLASEAASYIVGSTLTMDGGAILPVVAANDFT